MNTPEILTIYQVADLLGVHYATAYRLIRTGEIQAYKIASIYRIKREAVEAYLERVKVGGQS